MMAVPQASDRNLAPSWSGLNISGGRSFAVRRPRDTRGPSSLSKVYANFRTIDKII